MSKYAKIEAGKVVNVIIADEAFIDSLPSAETWALVGAVEGTEEGIGWGYANSVFTAPIEPPSVTTYKIYSYGEFLEELMEQGNTRKIMKARRADTDAGNDLEAFLEIVKAHGLVDFNQKKWRDRLNVFVPSLLTRQQYTAIVEI